jgi:hypothetical protein
MTIFDRLGKALEEQNETDSLPDRLTAEIRNILRAPERYEQKEYFLEVLLSQIEEYSPYAEAGCCKWAFDSHDIEQTLKKIAE